LPVKSNYPQSPTGGSTKKTLALKIPDAEFVLSAPHIGLAPKRSLPEIAFAGRSNVGKSSLINSLVNRKQLALSSKTPGKTRLLNYFLIGKDLCYFVDLPGYGYARVGQQQKVEWSETLEGYMRDARRLLLVVLILDIRQGLTPLDTQMIEAFHICQRPWLAVITKSDKLRAQARAEAIRNLSGTLLSLGAQAVLPYSALNHDGRNELWTEIQSTVKR
jgi:GTP-binding protein